MTDQSQDSAARDIPIHRSDLPEAKEMADLHAIAQDMQLVVNILNRLIAGEADQVLQRGLFSAALITYRRCFNTGVRNGLRQSDVQGLANNENDFHRYVWSQADKLAAHSVNPFEKAEAGVMVRDGEIVGAGTIMAVLINISVNELKQWGRLTVEIFETVLKPRIVAAHSALIEAARQLPIEEVVKMPLLSVTADPRANPAARRP